MQITITLNANSSRQPTPSYIKDLLKASGATSLEYSLKGNETIFDGDVFELGKLVRHCYRTSQKFEVV
jgi:hypothetical protein